MGSQSGVTLPRICFLSTLHLDSGTMTLACKVVIQTTGRRNQPPPPLVSITPLEL